MLQNLQSPLRLLQRLPPTVQVLVAGTFVNRLGSLIVPYLSLVLKRDFQLDAAEVGLLLSGYGTGSLASILAGGWLTDRLGRRRTLLVSLTGSGLLAVAMSRAPTLAVFLAFLVPFGFLADLYRPASSAMLADLLPSSQRAMGFAAVRLAVNLGFSFGVAVGGLLADWSWRLLFVLDGLTTLVFSLVVALFVAETAPRTFEPGAARGRGPWHDGVAWQAGLASLGFAFIILNFLTVLPLTVTVSAGYPARVYGAIMSVNGLLITGLEMTLVDAFRPFRRLRLAALGVLMAGLGFALYGLSRDWRVLLLGTVLWTLGEIVALPQLNAFLADWSPVDQRGRYLGAFQATWSLAFLLNPLVTLPLYAALGEARFWPTLLLVAGPVAFVLLRLDRTADRVDRLRGLASPPTLPPVLEPDTP